MESNLDEIYEQIMRNLVWAYKYAQYISLPKRPPIRNDCFLFISHTYWPRWWHSNSFSIYSLYYQNFHVYGWGHITINYTYIRSGKHVKNLYNVCGWRFLYNFLIPSICHCQCAHFSKWSSFKSTLCVYELQYTSNNVSLLIFLSHPPCYYRRCVCHLLNAPKIPYFDSKK
jgi:hypothetical protein